MTSNKLVEGVGRALAVQRAVGSDLARATELLKDCGPAAAFLAPLAEELAGFPDVIEEVLLGLSAGAEVPLENGASRAEGTTPSATLEHLYGRLNEAGLVCMTLHAFAPRIRKHW